MLLPLFVLPLELSPKVVSVHSLSAKFIEFFRGRPRGGNNFTSLSKCSRPFIQSVRSTLSCLKSWHPVRGTREAPLGKCLGRKSYRTKVPPNFSNFSPEFRPESCSELSPKFLRSSRASSRGKQRPEKNHPKIPAIFQSLCKTPKQIRRKDPQGFLESNNRRLIVC